MKKINPVFLLILFSILVFVVRKVFFPQYSDDALVDALKQVLAGFGPLSVIYLLGVYVICSFFFIPVLIPLNMVCGAIYGPTLGSAIALAGIAAGCLASTISVRYVFRGMGAVVMRHPEGKKFLNQITRHGIIVVILIRLAFVVPYLLQNIVLAMTNISAGRLVVLTLVGALPGVVSYCFLGAGLVSLDNANAYGVYLLVPLVLLIGASVLIQILHKRHGIGRGDE